MCQFSYYSKACWTADDVEQCQDVRTHATAKLSRCWRPILKRNAVWIYGNWFGAVVCFVDADKSICQLEHVVAEWYDNELRISGPLLTQH